MKKKLVCIDDSKIPLTYYREHFPLYGFEIDTFLSGMEALEHLKTNKPDCIVVDFEMPEMTGPEFTRIIKKDKDLKNIPVLILTGSDSKKNLLQAIDSGAEDFLSKSVDIEIIAHKINAVIRYGQLIHKFMELERYKTVHAMVTTLSHEINNPLQIAYGMLGESFETLNENRFEKSKEALERIKSVVDRIEELTSKSIEFIAYSKNSDMLDLTKDNDESNE